MFYFFNGGAKVLPLIFVGGGEGVVEIKSHQSMYLMYPCTLVPY